MKLLISLKAFLRTAVFGGLITGESTKKEVIQVMGQDYQHGNFGDTQIIRYGCYEFFYYTDSEVVFAIQNDHLLFDCSNHEECIAYENEQVKIDTWFVQANQNITFAQVLDFLKEEEITYTLEKQKFEGGLEYIKLSNGITIDFDNHREEDEDELIEDYRAYNLVGIRLFNY